MGVSITLPKKVFEQVKREAERLDMGLEEYIVEFLTKDLDPRDRAIEYIEAAEELLEEAREELGKGDIRQAAEKVWDVVALAVKAYAYWRDNRRLTSHGELWRYIDIIARELGEWVRDAFYAGHAMHTCFYEGWCSADSVKASLNRVEKLVKEIGTMVRKRERQ